MSSRLSFRLAVIVCLAFLAVSPENSQARHHPKHHPKNHGNHKVKARSIIGNIVGGIVGTIVGIGKGITHYITSTTMAVFKLGYSVISLPVTAVEYTIGLNSNLNTFDSTLQKAIRRDISNELGNDNKEKVQLFDFPGKDTAVLFYPSGLLSVVSEIKNGVMHLAGKLAFLATGAAKAAFAFMLHKCLQLIIFKFDIAMKIIGDCVPLPKQDFHIDSTLVDRIVTSEGKVCGIGNLKPSYNVNVTRFDDDLLDIEMPFLLRELAVNIPELTIPGYVEKEKLVIKITTVVVNSVIKFKIGSILKLIRFNIRIVKLTDFKILFENKKSAIMELIERSSTKIGELLEQQINNMFKKIENKIDEELGGK